MQNLQAKKDVPHQRSNRTETNLICFNPPISNTRGQDQGGGGRRGRSRAGGAHKACSFHCYISPNLIISLQRFQEEHFNMNQQKQFRKVGRCCSNRAAVWTTPCHNDLLFHLYVTAVVRAEYSSPMELLREDSCTTAELYSQQGQRQASFEQVQAAGRFCSSVSQSEVLVAKGYVKPNMCSELKKSQGGAQSRRS